MNEVAFSMYTCKKCTLMARYGGGLCLCAVSMRCKADIYMHGIGYKRTWDLRYTACRALCKGCRHFAARHMDSAPSQQPRRYPRNMPGTLMCTRRAGKALKSLSTQPCSDGSKAARQVGCP